MLKAVIETLGLIVVLTAYAVMTVGVLPIVLVMRIWMIWDERLRAGKRGEA